MKQLLNPHEKIKLNPKERIELFHSVLGVGKGLDVLSEIQNLFGVTDSHTFNKDPYIHAYQAGQRDAAYKISFITFDDPEKFKDAETKA